MERRKFLGVLPVAAGGALIMRSGEAPAQTTQSSGIWTNVKAYGAVGDGVTDDTAAINSAMSVLQQSIDSRGGVLYFPVGQYKCSSTLSFIAYSGGDVHNIIIRGDGPQCTTIDFTAAGSGADGITFNAGAQFGIEDLLINGAPGNGVVIGYGNSVGGGVYCQMFTIRNVRVQNCGNNGFFFVNAYMGTMSDCWSKKNGGIGFLFAGYHTSIDVNRCYADTNTGIGWSLNGMTYSSFTACGADSNVWGYAMTNMVGVSFNACGAEDNQREGWLLETSTASTAGLLSAVNDIHGVTFTSCSSYNNGQSNLPNAPNTYGSHISAVAQDSRPIVFKVSGNTSSCVSNSTVSMILNGSGGPITVYDELSYFSGTWVTYGSVTHKVL
jgi:hypothetical protein